MSDCNYYKVGGSLEYQHPTYVVRQADSDLYGGLQNGEFCYVLNSRQMGKSSLRVQMMKKLKEQGIKCASIDMTRIGSHVTTSEWYAGVVSELLRGFGLTRKVDFSSWWRQRELLPPLQRLRELIEDVLLAEFSQNMVIFIDEIDSIIKIKFKEDFFAFIRACYNHRVDNPEYNRLTFCLLGVATPSDLIEDKNRCTPFNIGRAIELTGFQIHEATPLAQGLAVKTNNPQAVLREVLAWTGGQPFLTQKVCKLVLSACEMIPDGGEAVWVEKLVRSRIIENWETQDEPEHLRTIRDRIVWSQRQGQLLQLYQQILQTGEVKANDKPEHMELRLSGLVVKQQGKLRVYNRIYGSIFNQTWVENALAEAGLLLEVAETPTPSKAAIQALEEVASNALRQFEFQQIKALLLAMQAGQALKVLVTDSRPLQDYPAISPLLALQIILNNIRERNQFKSHHNAVYDVCFSPNGQYLATGGDEGTIKLWNLLGQQLAEWKGHQGIVYDVCFSPNGQQLATAGRDGTARLWNLSGQEIAQFGGHPGWVYSVSFSPDGQCLATAGGGRTARLWNLSGQQIAQFDGHHKEVWSTSFSPNGQQIVTAGRDGTARLWNLSGQQIAQFDGHQGAVWSASFSPDGHRIVTAGADGTARLWNLSGQQLAQLNGHQDWVRSASFSPNGQYIATVGYDGTARLWNFLGQQLVQLQSHIGAVLGMSFSPDGQHLATAGADGTVRLWDLSEKHLPQLKGHQGKVWSVSFSPDGQSLATASSDGTARLWNLAGQQLAQCDGHQDSVWTVSFSPDGHYLVTTGSDSTARLWNLSGQQLAVLGGHRGWVTRVSFSPDGQRLATVGRDGTAKLWDLSGQLISQVNPHQGWVWSVSFSSDGQLVATVGVDSSAPILDSSGRLIVQLKNYQDTVIQTSFSPDGQLLATVGGDGTARVWNLAGKQLAQLGGHQGWVSSVSFSPDGQRIATAGEDRTIRLWDLSGRQIAKFDSNQGVVYGMSFWDLSGRQITKFDSNQGVVYGMSFSPNGQYLAAGGQDGTVQLWRVENLYELLARGCYWLKDYFFNHPEALEKLEVCQDQLSCVEEDKNRAGVDEEEDATLSSPASTLIVPNNLSSESSIAYTRLRNLLKAEQWQEAAWETTALMLRISNREAEGWLREEDIENFPCTDLLIIDRLWVKYSEGRFGFSVQNKIWQSSGGTVDADYKLALKLAECKVQPPGSTTIARSHLVTTGSNESEEGFLGEFLVHDKLVRIYQGDITNLVTDVIVSSDDNYLTMSDGVSKRIRQVGGNEIYKEARDLRPFSFGEIAVTTAGKLQAKKIFHGVIIDFGKRKIPSRGLIKQVVHKCMKKASEYKFQSIAFSLLSTGVYRSQTQVCWEASIEQIIRDLSDDNQNVIEVIVALYERRIVDELQVKSYLERIQNFGWRSLL